MTNGCPQHPGYPTGGDRSTLCCSAIGGDRSTRTKGGLWAMSSICRGWLASWPFDDILLFALIPAKMAWSMTHGLQQYRPGKPPMPTTDLWVSITALTLTVLLGVGAAVTGLFSLAFLDYCPPESCSADGAVTAVATALLIAALVGTAGLIITIVRLTRRKPAWPFAVATLVACTVVVLIGGIGYAGAVGARGP